MDYIRKNGGDPKTACYKKGHELGMTDEQIDILVKEQTNNITTMLRNNMNPNMIIQNAFAAKNPRFAQLMKMNQYGNELGNMMRNSAK